jgi:hypothetical protein
VDAASGRYTLTAAPGLGYSFRWDADADGKPDSEEFGDNQRVELMLPAGESRSVVLEVRNAFGRVGSRKFDLTRKAPTAGDGAALGAPPDARRVARLGEPVRTAPGSTSTEVAQ